MPSILKTTGEKTEVAPADGKKFTLAEIQAICGGWVEMHVFPTGAQIWMNENGKITEGVRYNPAATKLWQDMRMGKDLILGDVLICGPEWTE